LVITSKLVVLRFLYFETKSTVIGMHTTQNSISSVQHCYKLQQMCKEVGNPAIL